MNLSAPFVRRPIGTILMTIGVALAGAAAFFQLPVSPLPQVDFPTVLDEQFEGTDAARVRTFMSMLRYTALRIGDVTNLQKTHLTGDKILLRTLKNGQPVYTVIPESLVQALDQIKTDNEHYFYRIRLPGGIST